MVVFEEIVKKHFEKRFSRFKLIEINVVMVASTICNAHDALLFRGFYIAWGRGCILIADCGY